MSKAKSPPRFDSVKSLVNWLTATQDGEEALRMAIGRHEPSVAELILEPRYEALRQEIADRCGKLVHVVLEINPEGFVRLLGPSHVRVKVLKLPAVHRDSELIRERWARKTLPYVYRDAFDGKLIAMTDVRCPTLEELLDTIWCLEFLAKMKEVRASCLEVGIKVK